MRRRVPARAVVAGTAVGDHAARMLGQPGVLADRAWRPARHSLMPLYCGRVVARGEHRAGQVRASRRRSRARRCEASPMSTTSTPCAGHALGERGDELGAGGAHVVADDDGARAAVADRRRPTTRTKAAPTRSASSSSSWSGTTPRTS